MLGRFGFCLKWRDKIRDCVSSGSLLVLVNGSPAKEINIYRGHKKCDLFAPFLFFLVSEGLGGLVRSVVERYRFAGFRFGSPRVEFSHI